MSSVLSILILGHSLSAIWPQYLPEHRYEVRNEAVPGFGTAQGWDVFFFDLLAKPQLPADWCTMIFGTGPATLGMPLEVHEAHLRSLIGKALAHECGRILMIPSPPTAHPYPHDVGPFRALHLRLCQQITGVTCGPNLSEELGSEEVGPDGVHLTRSGERRVAKLVDHAIWTAHHRKQR